MAEQLKFWFTQPRQKENTNFGAYIWWLYKLQFPLVVNHDFLSVFNCIVFLVSGRTEFSMIRLIWKKEFW